MRRFWIPTTLVHIFHASTLIVPPLQTRSDGKITLLVEERDGLEGKNTLQQVHINGMKRELDILVVHINGMKRELDILVKERDGLEKKHVILVKERDGLEKKHVNMGELLKLTQEHLTMAKGQLAAHASVRIRDKQGWPHRLAEMGEDGPLEHPFLFSDAALTTFEQAVVAQQKFCLTSAPIASDADVERFDGAVANTWAHQLAAMRRRSTPGPFLFSGAALAAFDRAVLAQQKFCLTSASISSDADAERVDGASGDSLLDGLLDEHKADHMAAHA